MNRTDNVSEYIKAIEIGFDKFGLNGFYEMHSDICKKESPPWEEELKVLNDLNYADFELICDMYLKKVNQ